MSVSPFQTSVSSARRRTRAPIAVAIGVALLVVLAAGMYLYDHSRRDLIAGGVTVAGVSVGGLHEQAARVKIERELGDRLQRPVTVSYGGQRWTLGPQTAALRINAANMAAQALDVSREGSIVTRTFRGLFGGSLKHEVPLVVSYSHQAVAALAARVRAACS